MDQMPHRPTPQPTPSAPAASGGTQDSADRPLVPVRICAVIYIYNPPDRDKLGIPEEKNPAAPANGKSPAGGASAGAAALPPKKAAPGK